MMITCDAESSMGYIYLMPPSWNPYSFLAENHFRKYNTGKTGIPLIKDTNIKNKIDRMKQSEKSYLDAIESNDIDQEYHNDISNQGYIKGIELTLYKDHFIKLIESKAYRIYEMFYQEEMYYLITLDFEEEVFNPKNIIYPMTDIRDTFLLIFIEDENRIGFVKALLTKRVDLYPLEYLKVPQFVFY